MHINIISPERILFSGEARQVTAPGSEGDFGVLPGHAPLISLLRPGTITVDRAGEAPLKLAVAEGLAEVTATHCTILTQKAVPLDGITGADAQAELAAAQTQLDKAVTEEETKAAEARLTMAQAVVEAVKG